MSNTDNTEYMPLQTTRIKEMGIELCHIPQFIGLIPVDCLVLSLKDVLEHYFVALKHFSEALGKEPIEAKVCPLLCSTLN